MTTPVCVNKKEYQWDSTNGLDPHAVLSLKHYIYSQANKFAHTARKSNLDIADLVQVAYLGAIQATTTYNPEQGAFITYASKRIRGEIITLVTREKKQTHPSIDEAPELEEQYLTDHSQTSTNSQTTDSATVSRLLGQLTEADQSLIKAYYGIDQPPQTLKQLASQHNYVTRSTISARIDSILGRIRQQISNHTAEPQSA